MTSEEKTRAAFLEQVWLYYWQYKSQYWDVLDDIENELAQLWHTDAPWVSKKLARQYRAEQRRTRYAKGQLPPQWRTQTPLPDAPESEGKE